MSKVNFKLNKAGVRELLKSGEMMQICAQHANEIAGKANSSCPGYEVTTHTGPSRVNASVVAATSEARKDNYDNNTLLKARGGGR